MQTVSAFLIKLGVIAVLIICSLVSFRWMIGDFYGERIATSLEKWSKQQSSPSEAVIDNHLEFSDQSLKWAPSNPRYKELRARLLIMQMPYLPDNQQVYSSLDQIMDLHRAAAQERPKWPFSWANLFAMKGVKQEFDDEYRQALNKAVSYGPYEVGALQRVIRSSARYWGALEPADEAVVFQAIANGVKIDGRLARNLRKILAQNYLLEDACEEVRFHSESSKARLCG